MSYWWLAVLNLPGVAVSVPTADSELRGQVVGVGGGRVVLEGLVVRDVVGLDCPTWPRRAGPAEGRADVVGGGAVARPGSSSWL